MKHEEMEKECRDLAKNGERERDMTLRGEVKDVFYLVLI